MLPDRLYILSTLLEYVKVTSYPQMNPFLSNNSGSSHWIFKEEGGTYPTVTLAGGPEGASVFNEVNRYTQ